ncbi:hypothetical protein M378DRAFT_159583 [Amanita muscaria Koide BX008]|uniref:Uncharacterized protein n=1 Tax=Amanita muscaria (strain Koide BX008) TaxID=946122 RepID=A0A0C2SUT8_AMAMK|nr:hypothetical protein M378DRAFT_159583 [Amanita muscaria Koide BX008]
MQRSSEQVSLETLRRALVPDLTLVRQPPNQHLKLRVANGSWTHLGIGLTDTTRHLRTLIGKRAGTSRACLLRVGLRDKGGCLI